VARERGRVGGKKRERKKRREKEKGNRKTGKGLKRGWERRRERKTGQVVALAANEYLINLLAWMYLIPRCRKGTRTPKGLAKSWGSSYQRVNPSEGTSWHFLRAAPATTLSSAWSNSVSFLAHFRSLAFFSRQAEGNHEGRKRRTVTTRELRRAWLIRKRSNYLRCLHCGCYTWYRLIIWKITFFV